jgi:aryl-alcohol dehydrogenase-like predicted oxidoreductase
MVTVGGDLPVGRIGFGTMCLTGPRGFGAPRDRPAVVAALRRALALGVTLVDTADSYGPQVSESLIADALFPYPDELVIATKGGYEHPAPDVWRVNCRPDHLREALDGSLRRLRLDRIDLYQLHRIDPQVPEEDQFGFLQDAQRAGKIRHVGLSEASIGEIERARRYFEVASVQNRYNLVNREWEAVVDYCTREGIVFLPWAPLQQGDMRSGAKALVKRLTGRAPRQPALARIAARHRATRAQIALAWLLARSPIVVPIPCTSQERHLAENVAAVKVVLSNEEQATLTGNGAMSADGRVHPVRA